MADTARFVDENDALRLRMRMSGAPMPYQQEAPPMAQGGPVGLPFGAEQDPRDMSIASQRPTMGASPLVPPTRTGTERPERPSGKMRNPLHDGILGKRAIGGLKWGDLLGLGLLAAEPQGAMQALTGFWQGQQARQQREEAMYEDELANWQRQQAEEADQQRYEQDRIFDREKLEEDIRWHGLQDTNRDALQTQQGINARQKALMPIVQQYGIITPEMEAYIYNDGPFPDLTGLTPREGSLIDSRANKSDLDATKAFGFSTSPGLPFYGQGAIPTGTIGLTNATVPLRKAQTDNTQARTRDIATDNEARDKAAKAKAELDAANIALRTAQTTSQMQIAEARLGLAQRQYELNRWKAEHPTPKAPKAPKAPNQTDTLALHAKKSDMPLAMYKKWEANGGAYGKQAMESREFWISQGVIDPKTGDISELATPEQIKRFMDDQKYWLNGRWKYGGPGVRIDTWAKPAGQPAKPKAASQVKAKNKASIKTGVQSVDSL